MNVAAKPVERFALVRKIGQERIDQRDAARRGARAAPPDGQGRRRQSEAFLPVGGDGVSGRRGPKLYKSDRTRRSRSKNGHWRESKVSVLETYQSDVHEVDPDPDVPRCFLYLKRTKEMVARPGSPSSSRLGVQKANARRGSRKRRRKKGVVASPVQASPKRLVRSVLASRECAEDFGPMAHQAAWERNFFGAKRQGFLGETACR